MRMGLIILWILASGVSLGCWLALEWVFAKHGKFENRRKISGCVLARQVLDLNHHNRIAVKPVAGRRQAHFGLQGEQLLLAQKTYSGIQISDLAVTLHDAAHLLEESRSALPVNVWRWIWSAFRSAVLASWLLILTGLVFSGAGGLVSVGQTVFLVIFLLAFGLLGEEWGVTERAIRGLKQLEGLEIDELSRLKRLLLALRLYPLADLWTGPFFLIVETTVNDFKKAIHHGVS